MKHRCPVRDDEREPRGPSVCEVALAVVVFSVLVAVAIGLFWWLNWLCELKVA